MTRLVTRELTLSQYSLNGAKLDEKPQCIDRDFMLDTSCTAERPFSAAIWMLTVFRKWIYPVILEALMFLILNIISWDIKTVVEAIKYPLQYFFCLDESIVAVLC